MFAELTQSDLEQNLGEYEASLLRIARDAGMSDEVVRVRQMVMERALSRLPLVHRTAQVHIRSLVAHGVLSQAERERRGIAAQTGNYPIDRVVGLHEKVFASVDYPVNRRSTDTTLYVDAVLLKTAGGFFTFQDLPSLARVPGSENPQEYDLQKYARQMLPLSGLPRIMALALVVEGSTVADYLSGKATVRPDWQDPGYRIPLHPEVKVNYIPQKAIGAFLFTAVSAGCASNTVRSASCTH